MAKVISKMLEILFYGVNKAHTYNIPA